MKALHRMAVTLNRHRATRRARLSNKPHKMQIMIDKHSEPVQVYCEPREFYRRLSEVPVTEIREGELI